MFANPSSVDVQEIQRRSNPITEELGQLSQYARFVSDQIGLPEVRSSGEEASRWLRTLRVLSCAASEADALASNSAEPVPGLRNIASFFIEVQRASADLRHAAQSDDLSPRRFTQARRALEGAAAELEHWLVEFAGAERNSIPAAESACTSVSQEKIARQFYLHELKSAARSYCDAPAETSKALELRHLSTTLQLAVLKPKWRVDPAFSEELREIVAGLSTSMDHAKESEGQAQFTQLRGLIAAVLEEHSTHGTADSPHEIAGWVDR